MSFYYVIFGAEPSQVAMSEHFRTRALGPAAALPRLNAASRVYGHGQGSLIPMPRLNAVSSAYDFEQVHAQPLRHLGAAEYNGACVRAGPAVDGHEQRPGHIGILPIWGRID